MPEGHSVYPIDRIGPSVQGVQSFACLTLRLVGYDSMRPCLPKPAFQPRHLIFAGSNLETDVKRRQGLIADEDAKPEEFSLAVMCFVGQDRWSSFMGPL